VAAAVRGQLTNLLHELTCSRFNNACYSSFCALQLSLRDGDLTRLQAEADRAAEQQRVSAPHITAAQASKSGEGSDGSFPSRSSFCSLIMTSWKRLTESVEARAEALEIEQQRCRAHMDALQRGDFQAASEHIVRAHCNSALECKDEDG
jgi:hypothetical protein